MSGMRKWAKRRRCYCNTTLLDMFVCVFASGRQDDVGPGLHAWYQKHDGIPRDLSCRCCAPMNCNRKSWARPRDIDIIGFSTFTRSNFSSRWWCCAGFIVLHFPFLCVSALTLLCLWVVGLPLLEWNLTNKQAQNNKQKIPKNCNICEVGDGFHCLCENPRTAEWVWTCVSLPEATRVCVCGCVHYIIRLSALIRVQHGVRAVESCGKSFWPRDQFPFYSTTNLVVGGVVV